MAQSFEYPMFSPNEKAKLYKRLTNDMPVMKTDKIVSKGNEIPDSDVVTVQNNRYVCVGTFQWIEHTEKQDGDEQPLNGLIVESSYLTIKTNSLKQFRVGDIVKLPNDTPFAGFWEITGGATTDYAFTPKLIQRYQYLPLLSVG